MQQPASVCLRPRPLPHGWSECCYTVTYMVTARTRWELRQTGLGGSSRAVVMPIVVEQPASYERIAECPVPRVMPSHQVLCVAQPASVSGEFECLRDVPPDVHRDVRVHLAQARTYTHVYMHMHVRTHTDTHMHMHM